MQAIPGVGYYAAYVKGGRTLQLTGKAAQLWNRSRRVDLAVNFGMSGYYGAQGIQNGNTLQIGLSAFGLGLNTTAALRGWGRIDAPKGLADDFLAVNGRARPTALHDTSTPWYKFLSPKYDTDIWVRTAGRTPREIAGTWSHELQHFSDFTGDYTPRRARQVLPW